MLVGYVRVSTDDQNLSLLEAISDIDEVESWRKEINRPIYHIHKWWHSASARYFGRLCWEPSKVKECVNRR